MSIASLDPLVLPPTQTWSNPEGEGVARIHAANPSEAGQSPDEGMRIPTIQPFTPTLISQQEKTTGKLLPADIASPSELVKSSAPVYFADVERFMQALDVDRLLVIPAGVSIKCDFSTNGMAAVVIAGSVEGNIDAGACPVIIKQGGQVVGTVSSEDYVLVAGSVSSAKNDGNAILTKGLWVLAETGSVIGTVAYGRQRAYEGGVLNGRAVPFTEHAK